MSRSLLKRVRACQRNPRKSEHFAIEGIRALKQAVHTGQIPRVIAGKSFVRKKRELLDSLSLQNAPVVISDTEVKSLSLTTSPPGVISLLRKKTRTLDEITAGKRIFILDNIRNPGNMGTIIRSSHALGLDGIVLSPGCVHVYNPKVVRASLASICSLPVFEAEQHEKTVSLIKEQGFRISGTSPHKGTALPAYEFHTRHAVILGSESHGLSEAFKLLCHDFLKIPIQNETESLNVAVSASIIAYSMNC